MTEESSYTEPDNDQRYMVTDHIEIVRALRGLAKRKNHLLRAIIRGGEEVPSMVLGIDSDADRVYVDCSASVHDNRRLAESSRVHFVTVVDGVKIAWVSTSINKTTFDGNDAFEVPIPTEMQRLQRRECYRVDTPITNPIMCKLHFDDGKTMDLALVDVSIGGIGVSLPDSATTNLERGTTFPGCRIDFPGVGVVDVTLHVQMTWEVTMKNGNKSMRAGLEFVDLRSGTESMIQRYMIRLERERINNT